MWNASLKFPLAKANSKHTAKINFRCFLWTEGDIWVGFSEGKQSPALVRLHRVDREREREREREIVRTAQ